VVIAWPIVVDDLIAGAILQLYMVPFYYLLWASGYMGVLINAAKRHHWKSPPLKDCSALDLM
jgi:hypothetical protein